MRLEGQTHVFARFNSIEHVSIKAAILDGLEEMWRGDAFGAGEIGDGAGDLKYAIVGARRE